MAKCVLALKYLLGSDSYSACILLVRESLMVKSTVNKAGKSNCLPGIDSTVNKLIGTFTASPGKSLWYLNFYFAP